MSDDTLGFLKPKEITIADADGIDRTFIISRFPAVQGREIMAKYLSDKISDMKDYAFNAETAAKLMSFVAVKTGENKIRLSTEALINNHVGDWETHFKIEQAMKEYNASFLASGSL